MRKPIRTVFSALAISTSMVAIANAAQSPKVVVSIAPIHALVAGIMEGVGEPKLLISSGSSPHSYSLKPSEARALNNARVVVHVSDQLESVLVRPLKNLTGKAEIVTLSEVKGMTLYETRDGGLWESHDDHGHAEKSHDEKDHAEKGHDEHGHDAEKHEEAKKHEGNEHDEKHDHAEKHTETEKHAENEHAHEASDPHLWLDPRNAIRIVSAVSMTLRKAYPEHEKAFSANAEKLNTRLDELDRELSAATKPLLGKPYIVFHDAYRYFDERYGLNAVGAITVSPDRPTGAKRLAEIRQRIKSQGVSCVFSEPQFQPKLVQTLISGTSARAGTLDPLGAGLDSGPDLYFKLMRNMATSIAACLKNPS